MIHTQTPDSHNANDRFYAACPCGVVSPLRREYENAVADEEAHASVCSTRRTR